MNYSFPYATTRAARLLRTLLVAAALVPFGSAQSVQRQHAWTCTTTTRVKPEMCGRFERDLQRIVEASKKSGTPWFLTLQTLAGDTTEYTAIVPVMKFADLDGTDVPAVSGRLSRDLARCYIAQTRQYATPLSALEIGGVAAPPGTYWVETRSQAIPNKMDDYLTWLRDEYRPALDRAGVAGFKVSIAVFGAASGEVVSMRMLKNLAEIDGESILTRALGAERARAVNARGAALVVGSSTRILRVRGELTYGLAN